MGDFTSNLPNTALLPGDASQLASYFNQGTSASGGLAYGDLSYAAGGLANPQALGELLYAVFGTPLSNGVRLYDHLMYGTDWLMVLQESNVDQYFKAFQGALQAVDTKLPQSPRISERFFSLNAARWIGLSRGEQTRTRLESFYEKNGIDVAKNPPAWMAKLDANQT